MNTLQEIGTFVANTLGQPNNHELIERAKDGFKSLFAQRMRQTIEKSGMVDDEVRFMFSVNLIPVDEVDFCSSNTGCKILRSEYKIPSSVRITSDSPFSFVGDISGRVYTHIRIWGKLLRKYYPVTKNMPTYMFRNMYIYVETNTFNTPKQLMVENPFVDIEAINRLCSDATCYTDDMQFPVPEDMKMSIITELMNVLRLNQSVDNTISNEKTK